MNVFVYALSYLNTFIFFIYENKKKDLYSMLVSISKSVCWDRTQVGCFDVLFTPEHIVDMLENFDLDKKLSTSKVFMQGFKYIFYF